MQYQQTLWSFNGSGLPGLPVPLWPLQHINRPDLPSVPTHSLAMANVGSLHQMSDGTVRTSSSSEASSSRTGYYPGSNAAA